MIPLINISHIKKRPNCVKLVFNKHAITMIDSKNIIIQQLNNEILIKKPSFDTNKTYIMRKQMDVAVKEPDQLIGDYTLEQENEDFILSPLNNNHV